MTHEFAEFCRALGLRPRTIVADGRWRRCPTEEHPRKRNGAYKLAQDGRIGWAQDWSRMTEPATWRADTGSSTPAFDRDAFRRQQAEARRKMVDAIAGAQRFYASCDRLRGGHPYLESHLLDMRGCYGLRVDRDGWLVVPAFSNGRLRSVQRISPEGDKRFWPGAPVAGTSYRIDRDSPTVTVLCEGLATGLACFAALPVCRVVVAWNAGNLASMTDLPAGFVVIAADNDHGTADRIGQNPGLDAAEKAAAALGCGIAYPTAIEGTDWCDYLLERTAARMEDRKRFETEASIRQAVQAEIRSALMREARFRGAA